MIKKIISKTFNKFLVAKYYWLDILTSLIIGFIIIFISYSLIVFQSSLYFLKTFESKTISQLEIYHITHSQIVRSFFNNLLEIVKNISLNDSFSQAMIKSDFKTAQLILDSQLDINKNMELWTIFDSKGYVVLFSTKRKEFTNIINKNFAYRDYFQTVIKTKKPYIGQVVKGAVTGELIINFTAPIMNKNNEVKYVLSGSTSLNSLQKQLKTKSNLAYYYNVLFDRQGKVISYEGAPTINIKDDQTIEDPLLKSLMAGKNRVIEDEINFNKEAVFAMGDAIKLPDDNQNDYYFLSFFPKSQFELQIKGLKSEIGRMFAYIVLLFVVILFSVWSFNIWLISRKDKSRLWYLQKIGK